MPKRAKRGWIKPKRRTRWRHSLVRIQRGYCGICGLPMPPLSAWQNGTRDILPTLPTIDHVIPKDRGGVDTLGNLVLAHYQCNNAKGNRMPTGCELIWLLSVNVRLGLNHMGELTRY